MASYSSACRRSESFKCPSSRREALVPNTALVASALPSVQRPTVLVKEGRARGRARGYGKGEGDRKESVAADAEQLPEQLSEPRLELDCLSATARASRSAFTLASCALRTLVSAAA